MTFARRTVASLRSARAPRGGLLLALVLAVLLVVAVQTVVSAGVARTAMLQAVSDEAAQHAQALARRGPGLAADDPGPARQWLADLAAAPDVRAARLVDARGRVVATVGPRSAWVSSDARRPPDGTTPTGATGSTHPSAVVVAGGAVHVTAPVPSAGSARLALQLVLDDEALVRRSRDLQHRLVALLGVGGAATVLLWLGLVSCGRRRTGHDELTGLAGRRALADDLARHGTESSRTGRSLSVALLDLNGVSEARDAGGRRSADALLRIVSVLVRARSHGAYRVAGDGFAMLLPGLGPVAARRVAQDVADRVARDAVPLTADVGVASLDDELCPDAEAMIIRAENDLADSRERRGARRGEAAGAPPPGATSDPWALDWLDG